MPLTVTVEDTRGGRGTSTVTAQVVRPAGLQVPHQIALASGQQQSLAVRGPRPSFQSGNLDRPPLARLRIEDVGADEGFHAVRPPGDGLSARRELQREPAQAAAIRTDGVDRIAAVLAALQKDRPRGPPVTAAPRRKPCG